MVKVQRIRVPDTGHLSWIVVDGEHHPVGVLNEYLLYLHRLGRSPNTVRAYAHHLQSFWAFLAEQDHDWQSFNPRSRSKRLQIASGKSGTVLEQSPSASCFPFGIFTSG